MFDGWVPVQMLTGVIAEPKAGKSGFALDALARPIITASGWFNGSPGFEEPGHVIYCDTERSAALNIERARKWGLPLERIKTPFLEDPLCPVNLEDPEHIERILGVVCKYKAPLVIIDSFRGAHDGDENNSRIVKCLRALGGIAENTGAAVVLIHHTKKMSIGEDLTINAGRGSNAFLAAVRCQIAIDIPNPEPNLKEARRRVQVLGENLGVAPRPVGFQITDTGLVFGSAPMKPKKQTQIDDAAAWLQGRLKPGTHRAGEVIAEAEQYGHSKRTVQRAATERLGLKPEQVREDGKIVDWAWIIPSPGGS